MDLSITPVVLTVKQVRLVKSEVQESNKMFGLGKLLYVIVLSINGIAVLSEDRFLNRIGWGSSVNNNPAQEYQHLTASILGDDNTIKKRLVNLISAIRTLMRLPLIVINVLIILYELILG